MERNGEHLPRGSRTIPFIKEVIMGGMSRLTSVTCTVALGLLVLVAAATNAGTQQGLTALNVDDQGVILHGYDAVAFQTENRAVEGSTDFTATHDGAIYRFTSAENRDVFRANPAKFAPTYGGYCSTGVAFGLKYDGDPTMFIASDGQLNMFGSQQAQEVWGKDITGNTAKADGNWGKVSLKRGFDPLPTE